MTWRVRKWYVTLVFSFLMNLPMPINNIAPEKLKFGVIVGFILLIIIAVAWRHIVTHPSTDNAYVQANIVNIAPQVTGAVVKIAVQNHQAVTAGQVLFVIDPRPFQYALGNADALVAQRQAELLLSQQNAQRILKLVDQKQLPPANGDTATANLNSAKAALVAAQDQQQQAQLNLQHTQVVAPAAGVITNFTLRVGTTVTVNQDLFALIEQDSWWVDANFKETQIKRIHAGQPVDIELDMYPGVNFNGTVQAVSAGSGAIFSLLPPENATGNWVKVTQRFPVKIMINSNDHKYPLRVGASADVTVDTTK